MDAGNCPRIEPGDIDAALSKLRIHEIDKGRYDETYSVDGDGDIRTYMPNFTWDDVTFEKGEHLTVFWKSESFRFSRASLTGEVEDNTVRLLQRVKFGTDSILLQFWKATTVLSIVGQPFGLGHFYKGLWRYRKRCLEHSYDVIYTSHDERSPIGPPGRVFENRTPEFCPNIEAYTTDEFPLRDFAINECGIQGYWALPLFRRGTEICVGVLEFVAFKCTGEVDNQVNPVIQAVKKGDLCFHSLEAQCTCICKDVLSPQVNIQQVLKFVREVNQLPLIQAWLPCMCNNREMNLLSLSDTWDCEAAELFCETRSCARNVKYASDFLQFKNKYGTLSVQEGKGLIGKAYSLKKTCFCTDTSQLSISDYPFVHLTRRAGFTACFALPLKFFHPSLDAFLLEIYLPPEQNYSVGEPLDMLKSLLSTLAHGFSRLNVAFGLKEGEEFSVKFSHSEGNFSFFDICRQSSEDLDWLEVLVNERGKLQLQSSHHPVPVPMAETNATNVKKRNSSSTRSKTRDRVETSEGVYTNGEAQITLDVLRHYFGRNLVDAAESLRVSRSTLKRICRSFGIDRWPSHKRKECHIRSSLRLPTASVEEVIQEPDEECYQNISAVEKEVTVSVPTSEGKIDKYSMIVKATYGEDKVVFPLHSNSIEYLSHKIAKKFKLEVESFTIKYEDEDGDWIMIPSDEDLHFCIETLKSLGQSKIKLSVVPITLDHF